MAQRKHWLESFFSSPIWRILGVDLDERPAVEVSGELDVVDDAVNDVTKLSAPGPTIDNLTAGAVNANNAASTDAGGKRASAIRFAGVPSGGNGPTLTGLASGADRRRVLLMAVAGALSIANESASSTAANRVITGTGATVVIPEGSAAWVAYDATSSRWRLAGGGGGGSTSMAGDVTGTTGVSAVVAATGAAGVFQIKSTAANVRWDAATVSPKLSQADNTANGATGQPLHISGQNCTGTGSIGGHVYLNVGQGTAGNGQYRIAVNGTTGWTLVVAPTAQANLSAASTSTSVLYNQAANATNGATGATTTNRAQNCTGTTSIGGKYELSSGSGTSAAGPVHLQTGGVDRLVVQASGAVAIDGFQTIGSITAGGFAATGLIRLPVTAAPILTVRNVANTDDATVLAHDGAGSLFVGTDATIGANKTWGTINMHATGTVYIGGNRTQQIAATGTDIKYYSPRHGNGTPYASEGRTIKAMGDANQVLSAAEAANLIIRTTGANTATRTLTLPLPASDAESYLKVIECANTTNGITVTAGTAVNVSVGAGANKICWVTPDGVRTHA